MLADYDGSNSIDLADFNTLKNAWTGTPKDYSMELGPVTGELPYLKIQPDNTFDLSDLLIGCVAKEAGCESSFTFDKKASRSELFVLLT